MASQVTTEITIAVGELPNPSGTQVCLDLVTGLQHVSGQKNQIRSRTGEDASEFKAYISIPCSSPDAAAKLTAHLNKTYTEAISNAESMMGSLYQKIKPDSDEPALAGFEFKTFANYAFVIVTADQHEEQAQGMFGMVVEQAGAVLNSNNSVHIEIDTGRNLGEILSPQLSQMLTESGLFKIVVNHDSNALNHAKEIITSMGMDKKIVRALAFAGLYSGANLKLTFKSGSHLPETAQGALNSLSAMIPPLDQILPAEVTAFIHGIFEHSGHEFFVNFFAGNVGIEAHFSLKGASQIFQLN